MAAAPRTSAAGTLEVVHTGRSIEIAAVAIAAVDIAVGAVPGGTGLVGVRTRVEASELGARIVMNSELLVQTTNGQMPETEHANPCKTRTKIIHNVEKAVVVIQDAAGRLALTVRLRLKGQVGPEQAVSERDLSTVRRRRDETRQWRVGRNARID